jgi:hypothetical protein
MHNSSLCMSVASRPGSWVPVLGYPICMCHNCLFTDRNWYTACPSHSSPAASLWAGITLRGQTKHLKYPLHCTLLCLSAMSISCDVMPVFCLMVTLAACSAARGQINWTRLVPPGFICLQCCMQPMTNHFVCGTHSWSSAPAFAPHSERCYSLRQRPAAVA